MGSFISRIYTQKLNLFSVFIIKAIRHFRKLRGIFKGKNNDLETNTKNKNIRDLHRDVNEFKKGYQPRTNLVKDEKCDLLTDAYSILNR
jgi:hypothetical protein